jgi:predicted HicB family RNase H-like nuclease
MKTKKITAKDYVKLVEWSDEDQCFVGSAPPIIGPCCHGSDEAKVYAELCQIVAEWIAIYEKDGRPLPEPTAGREYSGKFVVRMDPELHKATAIRALREGESLNNYIVKKLATA